MTNYEPGSTFLARVERWPSAREWPEDTSVVRLVVEGDGYIRAQDGDPAAPLTIPPGRCREYIHPLVVLDLDALPVRPLSSWRSVLRQWQQIARKDGQHVDANVLGAIAEQIEAQTGPPKPAEPTGLGAVVQDRRNSVYVRTALRCLSGKPAWRLASHSDKANLLPYADIDAVEVLSEGVA